MANGLRVYLMFSTLIGFQLFWFTSLIMDYRESKLVYGSITMLAGKVSTLITSCFWAGARFFVLCTKGSFVFVSAYTKNL